MRPLLSILIPTKNRYYYLESCLNSLHCKFNNSNVEIIITDNSSSRQDIKALDKFKNIKYTYIERAISQVENFELALEKVTGKYVTMIGDDDGVSNSLLNVVQFMDRYDIDSLNSPFLTYYWPDVISKNKINNFSGKLFSNSYTFQISEINSRYEQLKCLSKGGTSLCNMPRMYYGVIKKDILDKVKNETGFYFPGPSPDMANAFSVSSHAAKSIFFDAPLFIAGNSPKSAAGLGLAGKHVGDIENHPLLPKDCHKHWSKLVPKFWSGPTIWAESVLQVISKSSRNDLINSFNFPRLYASCIVFNPEFKDKINYSLDIFNENRSAFNTMFLINFEKAFIWLIRFKYLITNVLNRIQFSTVNVNSNVLDIQEASNLLNSYQQRIKAMIADE